MDRIMINVVDRKTEYVKRIVLDVKTTLTNCDFVTIGDDLMFDRDTDFLTFGYDVNGRMNQLAIVTGEGHDKQGKELAETILAALKGFDKVSEDENQVWLREALDTEGTKGTEGHWNVTIKAASSIKLRVPRNFFDNFVTSVPSVPPVQG